MKAGDIKNIEAEAGVIASVVLKPELIFYSEQLKPNHFTNEQNAYIYYAVRELARQGVENVDAYNIINILNMRKATSRVSADVNSIITIQSLQELFDNAALIARTTPEDYSIIVDAVVDAAFRRDTYNKLVECENVCFSSSEKNISQKIYSMLDDVIMSFSATNDIPLYRDVIDDIWTEIKERQNGATQAIDFPFPTLNKYVVMEPGEVICFAGGAKSGKSSILLTCTVDLLKKDKSVLVIDSEISTKLYTLRLLSHLTKISFGKLRSGNYSGEEAQMLEEAVEWIKTRRFIHKYMPIFDEDAVYLAAQKAKHMIDIDVICVDYLKSTGEKDEAFAVYNEMGRFSDTLKNRIAGGLGICGITAVQSTVTGKIADSSKIARNLSTIITISDKSQEELENDETGGTKKLRVKFNRNGAQMDEGEWIDMRFIGSTITYEETEVQHSVAEPF